MNLIIGCDEVGWGSLAGMLIVCGVAAPEGWTLAGLNDSKKLTDKRRHQVLLPLMKLVESREINYHLAERSNQEIDRMGAAAALKSCYVEIFHALHQSGSIIIVDGNLKFDNLGVDTYTIR